MFVSTYALGRHAMACALCAMTVLLTPAGSAVADEAAIDALRQELAELRERVNRLEAEIATGVAANPAKVVQPVEGGWRAPSNWDLLTPGMEPYRVTEMLGEADRVRVVKKYEFWHYGDGVVRFYLGRVKSWDRP